jgi:type IV pilus assembly protein PilW
MRPLARQAGLSLIELMVAITISLFLLVGLVSVFATSNQTYMDLGRASQQIENGRFATQMLVDDISHAGFYGRYSQTPVLPGALPNPCISAAASLTTSDLALPLQGYTTHPGVPLTTCLPAANYLTGSILVVRRVDSAMTPAAGDAATIPNGTLTAGNIYLQSNADSTALPIIKAALGAGDEALFTVKNKDFTSFSPVRRYYVHIYFIAPCSVPAGGGSVCTGAADDNGSPIPTLKRIELTANNAMSVVPLVEGIENLKIDYGIDSDKDGVPDTTYIAAPALAQWPDVVAVRISVLSRQIEPTNGYVDPKTYDMGVAIPGGYAPGGGYKLHVYNAVIRIVNPASRRE